MYRTEVCLNLTVVLNLPAHVVVRGTSEDNYIERTFAAKKFGDVLLHIQQQTVCCSFNFYFIKVCNYVKFQFFMRMFL